MEDLSWFMQRFSKSNGKYSGHFRPAHGGIDELNKEILKNREELSYKSRKNVNKSENTVIFTVKTHQMTKKIYVTK